MKGMDLRAFIKPFFHHFMRYRRSVPAHVGRATNLFISNGSRVSQCTFFSSPSLSLAFATSLVFFLDIYGRIETSARQGIFASIRGEHRRF